MKHLITPHGLYPSDTPRELLVLLIDLDEANKEVKEAEEMRSGLVATAKADEVMKRIDVYLLANRFPKNA